MQTSSRVVSIAVFPKGAKVPSFSERNKPFHHFQMLWRFVTLVSADRITYLRFKREILHGQISNLLICIKISTNFGPYIYSIEGIRGVTMHQRTNSYCTYTLHTIYLAETWQIVVANINGTQKSFHDKSYYVNVTFSTYGKTFMYATLYASVQYDGSVASLRMWTNA